MTKHVIFDHSGVLVNDLRESWQAISKIVGLRDYMPDELNAFRRNFKLPYWEYLIFKGFNEREAKDSGVIKDYIRFYTETLAHVRLFDDVETGLSKLTKKGIELAVVAFESRMLAKPFACLAKVFSNRIFWGSRQIEFCMPRSRGTPSCRLPRRRAWQSSRQPSFCILGL